MGDVMKYQDAALRLKAAEYPTAKELFRSLNWARDRQNKLETQQARENNANHIADLLRIAEQEGWRES